MTEDLERCIAAAKGLAAKESGRPLLDSFHLLVAAVRLAPQAAKKVLESSGLCWETLRESCPNVDATTPAPEVANAPMRLTRHLERLVYGPASDGTNARATPLATEECLTILMRNPSARLRAFLRTAASKAASPPDPGGRQTRPPYRSFREYLADLRGVWALRCRAWNELQDAFFAKIGTSTRRQPQGGPVEAMIGRMLEKDEQTSDRARTSADTAIPTRCMAARHNLSAVQLQLLEGLRVYELYVSPESAHSPACVRDLAQMLSPDAYPRNCESVVSAVQGLVKQELVQATGPEEGSLHARIRLSSSLLADLLAHLANDVINDDDVAMARRHLSACRNWPL